MFATVTTPKLPTHDDASTKLLSGNTVLQNTFSAAAEAAGREGEA